jgi:ferredoxin-NADP reductase
MTRVPTEDMSLRVRSVSYAATDVIIIEFVDPAEQDLPAWEPGSHLEIVLPSGLIRHYSLCGPAQGGGAYQVAVLRVPDGRGGSAELHDTGLVGRELTVRGPRNRFRLVDDAPGYLLIAGGIGVTPLVPMARALAAAGRPFDFVYGARSSCAFAFAEELRELAGPRLDLVDEQTQGRPDVARIVAEAPDGAAVYCCGPEGMIRSVEAAVEAERGRVTLHVERFVASGEVQATQAGDSSFELVLQRSGKTILVPADRTALEMVHELIPNHPYSCRAGECGSCEVAVLEGEVEHRDEVLSDDEHEANCAMMLCVSRGRSPRLVIDL